MEDLLTAEQAANILGLKDAESVRQYAKKDRIPYQRFGKSYLFKRSDVLAFKAIPRRVGNPGKKGRTTIKASIADQLVADFNKARESRGDDVDLAHAKAMQLYVDDKPKKRK